MADFESPIPKTPEVVDQHLVDYYTKMGSFLDGCYEEGVARQKTTPELKAMDEAIDYLGWNPMAREAPQLQAEAGVE